MYRKQIEDYFAIHKDEMLNDICSIIKIKSDREKAIPGMPFGEGPAKALELALNLAQEMGFKTKNYDNYVGTIDLNGNEKGLDILAHLDVVPVSDDWKVTKPFEPIIKDGKLYGRGSADDKGPAIVALYALKAVKDLNIPLSKNARLILGTDEECGSEDIDYYYKIEKEAPMTFSPDAEFPVINIEKGRLASKFEAQFEEDVTLPRIVCVQSGVKANVVPDKANATVEGFNKDEIKKYLESTEQKTGIKFTVHEEANGKLIISAKGSGAHASTPDNGNNALTGMLELLKDVPFAKSEGFYRLCEVQKLFPHGDFNGEASRVKMSDEISGELTITLNIFEYTTKGFSGVFDCRAPICATNENLRDVLRDTMKKENISLSYDDLVEAHHVSEDSDFVRTLLKCYEEYSGKKGECLAIGGGTYVHHLKNGVAFGCTMLGTENNMHGNDEFANIDELILSAKIFTQAIIDLCK
ncbi:MAG: dipeptidase PepV [Clostridium sp.]|uniref:dipeptidase PepV n=1 Tax=Clostridium sp. TaxID=1506 RepID=UPI0025BEF65B|nr:dipeptidase PepV [Clostridium sp.]MCE5221201.1 dipeptidase PepV [Clostridium sp.]